MLLDELTSEQVTEWQAFASIEPEPQDQTNYMIAMLCSIVTNVALAMSGSKGKHKTFKATDFLPVWGEGRMVSDLEAHPVKAQTVNEMKEMFKVIAKAHGKTRRNRKMLPPPKLRKGGSGVTKGATEK